MDRMRLSFLDGMRVEPDRDATEWMFKYPYMAYFYGGMYVLIEGW